MLLIEAVKREQLAQIFYFLRAGIDVDLQDINGQTALIHCCFSRHSKKRLCILKLLLNNEVDVNKKDKYGRSAISWICFLGLTDLFAVLVDDYNGQVDLRTVDNDGNNLIMLAVMSRKQCVIKHVLKTLSKCGLLYQVNMFNRKGISPLLLAFHQQDKACADLLMSEGCAIVSTVLQNLKRLKTFGYTNKYILPKRGQAYFTKLRAVQRGDDDCKLKLPNEQEFLQFLYCSPEDLCHHDNRMSSLVDSRPTNTKIIVSELSCSSEDDKMKRTEKYDKRTPRFLNWTPADVRCQGRAKTAFAFDVSSRPRAVKTSPAGSSNVTLVTETNPHDGRFISPNSFENLYDMYSTQLSYSYRPSTAKAAPSPPPSEDEILTPPQRRSLLHRSSNLSQSSSKTLSKRSSGTSSLTLMPVPESAYDRQMRMNYSRSTRASSVQVKSMPRLSTKIKRTRSSTFTSMKVQE